MSLSAAGVFGDGRVRDKNIFGRPELTFMSPLAPRWE